MLCTISLSRHQARILLVNLLPRGLFCFRQIFSLRNLRLLHPYPTLAPSLPAFGRYAYSLTHGSSPWPTPHRLAARITPPTRPAPRGPRSPLRDSLSPPTGQGPCTPPGFFACFCTPLLPRPGLVPGLPTRTDQRLLPFFFACFCAPLLPRPGSVPGLPMRMDQRLPPSLWPCHHSSHEACDSDLFDQPSSCGCGAAPAARPTSRPIVNG